MWLKCVFAIVAILLFPGKALAMAEAVEAMPQELSEAVAFHELKQYDKSFEKIESYLSNGSDNKLWTGMAYYIKSEGECALNDYNAGFASIEKAVNSITQTDENLYKGNPIFREVFSEASAIAYILGLYDKSINYGDAYLNLETEYQDKNEVLQKRYLDAIYIIMESCMKLQQYQKVIEYMNFITGVSPQTTENSKILFNIMSQLGDASAKLGNWDDAVTIYTTVFGATSGLFGDEDPLSLSVKLKLASVLYKSGELPAAKEIYNELVAKIDKFSSSASKVEIINGYTNVLSTLGDGSGALAFFSKHIPGLEKMAANSVDLANLYFTEYSLQKSYGTVEQANIAKEKYLAVQSGMNGELQVMDQTFDILKDISEGKVGAVEARSRLDGLNEYFESIGDSVSLYYYNYIRTELSYYMMQKKSFPKKLSERFLNCLEKNYGHTHESYLSGISNLMVASINDGDRTYMREYLNIYVTGLIETLSQRLILMDKGEREAYWKNIKMTISNLIPTLVVVASDEQCNLLGYQAALVSKGLLLQAEFYINDILASEEIVAAETSRLENIENVFNQIIGIGSAEENEDELIEEFLYQLSEGSPLYAKMQSRLNVSAKDVLNSLRPEDMAVEFLWVETDDNPFLMAYILRKGWETPKVGIFLTQKVLDKFGSAKLSSKIVLSMGIWGKLKEYADNVKNIYFSPDGPLHNIAIESFPDFEQYDKLISERWNLSRLSSTRELAFKNGNTQQKNAMLFGGMIYDAPADSIAENYIAATKAQTRGLELTFDDIADMNLRSGVSYLPETLVETDTIADMFGAAKVKHDKFTGTKASENNFKILAGGDASIIHIATHGFYWTKKYANRFKSLSFLEVESDDNSMTEEDMALRRSGLLFSGANSTLKGIRSSTGGDDGVLTAQEISNLNMANVDLLVLSACETGLGDISSDGVFGLQRGFKKAGVNSILMSLWKVNDTATRMLMTKFYENYLSGKSKRQSLLDAQRYVMDYEIEVVDVDGKTASQLRKEARAEGYAVEEEAEPEIQKVKPFNDPIYWEAFILLDALD